MKLKNLLEQILDGMDSLKEVDLDIDGIKFDEPENQKIKRFNIGNLRYQCDFTKRKLSNNKSILLFDFQLLNNPNQPNLEDFYDISSYHSALVKSQMGTTGTGKPFETFKYVIAALKDYLKNEPIDYITFVGDENHSKIYKHAGPYFKKYLGSKKCEKNPINDSSLKDGEFWFEKI